MSYLLEDKKKPKKYLRLFFITKENNMLDPDLIFAFAALVGAFAKLIKELKS